jgi:hypothetical protein
LFKLEKVVSVNDNTQEYWFADNKPNDLQTQLSFTIISQRAGAIFSLTVKETKNIMRIIPSETHKVELPSATNQVPKAFEYHFHAPKSSNIQTLSLQLYSPSDQSVDFDLRIRTQISDKLSYEEVPVKKDFFKKYGVLHFGVENQPLIIRNGVYILSLSNKNKSSAAKVQFRFVYNDVREMEVNGMVSGFLNNSARDIVQIAFPTKPELTWSFFSCSGDLRVSYYKNELDLGNPGTEIFQISTKARDEKSPALMNFTTTSLESDVYYIQIQSVNRTSAEYTLISRQHQYGAGNQVSEIMSLGHLISISSSTAGRYIDFHFQTPVISIANIKQSYPNLKKLVIQITAVIYGGIKNFGRDIDSKIRAGMYCPKSFDNDPDLIRASDEILVDESQFYSLPSSIKVRKQVTTEYHSKLLDLGMAAFLGELGKVMPLATLYIYEQDDLEPTGIVAVHGQPTAVNPKVLFMLSDSLPPEGFLETTPGRILIITGMVMLMIVILITVYFCAHRISGGYRRIENDVKLAPELQTSGTEMSGLKSLETSKGTATDQDG